MRMFVWVLRFVVFGVLVAFAAQNHAPVTVEWFGRQWQAPLAVVLLVAALVGEGVGAHRRGRSDGGSSQG